MDLTLAVDWWHVTKLAAALAAVAVLVLLVAPFFAHPNLPSPKRVIRDMPKAPPTREG